MELNNIFKAILEADKAHIVVCDTEHTIIYMNKAADANYHKWGGHSLVGKSIFDCHNSQSRETIIKVTDWFRADKNNNVVHTFFNEKKNNDVYMIALRDDDGNLIAYYEKHECRTRDNMPFYDI